MQLLHLHWLTPVQPEQHGRLFVWAEAGVTNQLSGHKRKKQAQPHPRTASPQAPVSYTHLTLPTSDLVKTSGVAV